MVACRERRRLHEMMGLEGKDDCMEDKQVGRCSSRALDAEDVCPAASHGYAVRSARHPRRAVQKGARCLPALDVVSPQHHQMRLIISGGRPVEIRSMTLFTGKLHWMRARVKSVEI